MDLDMDVDMEGGEEDMDLDMDVDMEGGDEDMDLDMEGGDEEMDVDTAGDPGFETQGYGTFCNGSGPAYFLFLQRIKSVDFDMHLV